MNEDETRRIVRQGYGRIARQESSGCGCGSSCCGGTDVAGEISRGVGYSDEELGAVPVGANLGLGCGNPVALASLREGETVLDLGSGGGFDCFLAANAVGESGKVIGVDMTPEMIERARENAGKGGYRNVEFRLGEIENLPAGDNSVDVVISNCVINLSPDKARVFAEAFRVLKPGGSLMVSDIVLLKELPDAIRASAAAYVGCISGAMMKDDYLGAISEAGFRDVEIADETRFPLEMAANDPTVAAICCESSMRPEDLAETAGTILSLKVQAVKPGATA
jgi:arsenite methyltransferase